MTRDCPICGKGEAHEHIVSNALPPGEHSTYEELLAEVERYEGKPPTFAELSNLQDENEDLVKENARIHKVKDTVLRERQTMETRCRELNGDIEDFKRWNGELKESIIAILKCASTGGPDDLPFSLGLIRIECNRVLGSPGAQAVDKLSDTMCSTDELLEQLQSYMDKHVNATGSGPCCPPGRCKEGPDPLKCSRWKAAQALAPDEE